MDWQQWAPYVPVAERRRRAMRKMESLRKKGANIQPVQIEGLVVADGPVRIAKAERREQPLREVGPHIGPPGISKSGGHAVGEHPQAGITVVVRRPRLEDDRCLVSRHRIRIGLSLSPPRSTPEGALPAR